MPQADAKKLAEAVRQTLNLPKTAFPMRANAAKRELELHKRCVTYVYETQKSILDSKVASNDISLRTFTLHDGPPFANGNMHMGHFLNKTLKDIVNRYKLMQGYTIDYVPGWDCHGLPIEVKALEQLRKQQEKESENSSSSLSSIEIRKLSRSFALQAIASQKNDFIRWGILANWNERDSTGTYMTMDPFYEAKQYDVLRHLVRNNLVYRGYKPVFWSPSSRTALAEAELEYVDDHQSQAAYIRFPVIEILNQQVQKDINNYLQKHQLSKMQPTISAVIWTTTPWTIPANMALSVHPDVEYAIVPVNTLINGQIQGREFFILAKDLIPSIKSTWNVESESLCTTTKYEIADDGENSYLVFSGRDFIGSVFSSPVLHNHTSIVIPGDHVTTETGTGIVHTAPGHGQDDYIAWLQYKKNSNNQTHASEQSIRSPVDNAGKYTRDVGLETLEGLEVLTHGNAAVLDLLAQTSNLVHVSNYTHRYPYDWRTKKPILVRATAQWFAQVAPLQELGNEILRSKVSFVPPSAHKRLEATLASRTEWCISRQRAWGLPIPVFYHCETQEPLLNDTTIKHIQEIVKTYKTSDGRQGSDCWWDLPVRELLPPSLQSRADEYVKGMDTLDVWFDSGSSWHAILPESTQGKKQADIYLEGSDQHRGWFQSSFLTSLAVQGQAPYKRVITHGFALDERGSKMSKSLGNTMVPNDFINGCVFKSHPSENVIIDVQKKKKSPKAKIASTSVPAYGVDVLRYWVASTDYTGDVTIGPSTVAKVSDSVRKVRNTVRFLLGNLQNFDPTRDCTSYEQLLPVDKYLLHLLHVLSDDVTAAYETFAFNKVQSAIAHFISTDLSAFYMEASKDRLYCDGETSPSRRASQTVLWTALLVLTRAIAPVVCHTAEDIRLHWLAMIQNKEVSQLDDMGSIFLDAYHDSQSGANWLPVAKEWKNENLAKQWKDIRNIRFEVNSLVEELRAAGSVGSQLECNVWIVVPTKEYEEYWLKYMEKDLEDIFLCSRVYVVPQDFKAVETLKDDTKKVEKNLEKTFGIKLIVSQALGYKCPRCWKYSIQVDPDMTKFCPRCANATSLKSTVDVAKKLTQE